MPAKRGWVEVQNHYTVVRRGWGVRGGTLKLQGCSQQGLADTVKTGDMASSLIPFRKYQVYMMEE